MKKIFSIVCLALIFSVTSAMAQRERAPLGVGSGDVDGDGVITTNDTQLIKDSILGRAWPTIIDVGVADVNGDGNVDIKDITRMNRPGKLGIQTATSGTQRQISLVVRGNPNVSWRILRFPEAERTLEETREILNGPGFASGTGDAMLVYRAEDLPEMSFFKLVLGQKKG